MGFDFGLFNRRDVRDTAGGYLATKTSYITISQAAFHPTNDDDAINRGNEWVQADVDNLNFFASVQLPHGAVVTGVIVYGTSAVPTYILYSKGLSSGAPSSAMAAENVNTEDTSITNGQINNQALSYIIEVLNVDTGIRIYSARITYRTNYD